MTLEDLRKIKTFQTRTIAEACRDEETKIYIINCLQRFFTGDYGEIGEEDTEANNNDLVNGCGHILARYKGKYRLENDFYIEAHFDDQEPGNTDFNNIMIMYPSER